MLKMLVESVVNSLEKDEQGKIKKTPITYALLGVAIVVALGYMEYKRYESFTDISDKIGNLAASQANIIGRLSSIDSLRTNNYAAVSSLLSYVSINDRILDELNLLRNSDVVRIIDRIMSLEAKHQETQCLLKDKKITGG